MNELTLANQAANWHRLKALVLNSVSSPITRRVYNLGLDEFIAWYGQEPRPGFTKGWGADGSVTGGNVSLGTVNTFTNSSRMCIAVDLDNAKIWFRVGAGNWNNNGSANPATNVGGIDLMVPLLSGAAMYLVWPAIGAGTTSTLVMYQLAADFTQAVPSGFSAWGAA